MRGADRTGPYARLRIQTIEYALPLPDADRAKVAARIAQELTLDGEMLLAVVVDDETRPAFTERWVDVVIPQIERLENVSVGLDNIVCTCHCHFLPGIAFPGHTSAAAAARGGCHTKVSMGDNA
jgi:hypothetical protein